MNREHGLPSLDSLNIKQMAEIIPRLSDIYSKLFQDPEKSVIEQMSKLTPKEQDEAMCAVRAQLLKYYVKARQDTNLTYEELSLKATTTGFLAILTERKFRGYSFPLSKMEVKPFYLPALLGLESGRLIDFLKSGKYVNKRTISATSSKVRSHFNLTPKFSNEETLAEFGFANPDLFYLPNDSIYKANPTYAILNKCLDNLGLPDLTTAENRKNYINNSEVTERVLLLLNELNFHPKESHLLLNVLLIAADKYMENHGDEITDPTSYEHANNFILLTYCASLLFGSVAITSAVISKLRNLSAITSSRLPTRSESINSFSNILLEKGKTKLTYNIFTKINPYNPAKYSFNEASYLSGVDTYFNEFFDAKSGINEILVDLVINDNSQLNSIKIMHLGDQLSLLLEVSQRDEVIELLKKIINSDDLTPEQRKHIDDFKALIIKWVNTFDSNIAHSYRFQETFQVPNKLLISIQMAISNIYQVSDQINKIENMQSELNEAHRKEDYARIINVAQELKGVDYYSIFNDLSESLTDCYNSILKRVSLQGSTIEFKNIEEDIENDSQITIDDKENKRLVNQNHQLMKNNQTLLHQNDLLSKELSLKKSEIDDMRKSEESRAANRLDEIERKFMFGEKTSISDVFSVIHSRFPYVTFADNISEMIESCQYTNSQKLLKFMYLLCDDYFNAIIKGTPDATAKNILGQAFRSTESDTVLNNQKLKRQRIFTVNGEEVLFTKHVNVSQSRDLKNSCSIYFDIDSSSDSPLLTIGYIGSHLDNTLT